MSDDDWGFWSELALWIILAGPVVYAAAVITVAIIAAIRAESR